MSDSVDTTHRADNARQTGPALELMFEFLAWLTPKIERFPRGHRFTLGDRIQTTALDVMDALIAATCTQGGPPIRAAVTGSPDAV